MTSATWGGRAVDEHAVTAPMWRGVVLFRVVALVAVVVNLLRLLDGYRRPGLAVAVVAAVAVWTVVVAVVYLRGDARQCRRTAIAELVVVPLATLATLLVDDPARIAAGGPVLTTVWSAGPVLALAVAAGWRGGLAAGVVTIATLAAVRQVADASFFYDAQLLLVAGLAVGLAADWMRAAARRMQEAVAVRAATAERERLARGIHDEVLQVLAFVRRRGEEVARTEPDGSAAEIARLAGEQEVALRRLVATGPTVPATGTAPGPDAATAASAATDLCAALAAVVPTRASLAVPAGPVLLDRSVAEALVAVVREAAANADRHAGPGSGLWVLVEDGDDEVTLSVRDDGAGIPAGRLATAEAEGRLGVASSMRGRVADLGGTITLHTGEDEGTEWEVTVPRSRSGGETVTVRVMVVDDHPMWREGVARDLGERGFDVVATAGDGAAAVRIAPAVRPDVVVMDLQLPHLSGAEATAAIREALPATRVLVLSASAEHGDVLGAVRAGASGYLVKSAAVEDLVDAVRRTAAGDTVFSPGLAGLVLGEYKRLEKLPRTEQAGQPRLTPRETEVLRLVAKGLSARAIAARLTLSHRTVENHVQNSLRKLALNNRVELTRYAIEQGLDEEGDARG